MLQILIAFIFLFLPYNVFSIGIQGKLLDATDNKPIAGAHIYLPELNTISPTLDDGSFKIDEIQNGSYTLKISSVGYNTIETVIHLSGTDSSLNFYLTPSIEDLETVVVTGTRSEKKLKDVPVLTQVIHPDKLKAVGLTSVGAALQHEVPGIEFAQFNYRPKISFQGMNAKYLLFLIDGERIAGEMDGDIDYYRLNLDNVERIEVVRGASSALYGSNAIGGVINIITKKAQLPLELNSHIRFSDYDDISAGTTIGSHKNRISSRTSVNYSQSGGYDINPDPSIKSQEKFKNASLNQRLDYRLSSKLNFVANGGVFYSHIYDGGIIPIDHGFAGINGYFKTIYDPNDSLHFELSYAADNYINYNIQILNKDQHAKTAYDFQQGIRLLSRKISSLGTFMAGVEFKPEKIKSLRIIDEIRTSNELIAFVQHDINFGQHFNLVTGARATRHSIYGSNFVPKISLMTKWNPFILRISYGKGFRSPTLKEMYYTFNHLGMFNIYGNDRLKPEKSDYFGTSIEFNKQRVNSSINLYYNVVNDMIFDSMMVSGDYKYSNIATAVMKGVDFMSRFLVTKNISTSIGISFVDARDRATKNRIFGISPLSITGNVNYGFKLVKQKSYVELMGKFTDRREFKPTPGHIYVDEPFQNWRLTFAQHYKQYFVVSIGADNIFNEINPTSLGNTSPGRRYFVSLNFNLNKY